MTKCFIDILILIQYFFTVNIVIIIISQAVLYKSLILYEIDIGWMLANVSMNNHYLTDFQPMFSLYYDAEKKIKAVLRSMRVQFGLYL